MRKLGTVWNKLVGKSKKKRRQVGEIPEIQEMEKSWGKSKKSKKKGEKLGKVDGKSKKSGASRLQAKVSVSQEQHSPAAETLIWFSKSLLGGSELETCSYSKRWRQEESFELTTTKNSNNPSLLPE